MVERGETRQEKLRLGGMALGNGLLVHGPTQWAAAVRRTDGTIGVASGPKPRVRGRVERVPGVRGIVRLGEAMAVIPLVKRALPARRAAACRRSRVCGPRRPQCCRHAF